MPRGMAPLPDAGGRRQDGRLFIDGELRARRTRRAQPPGGARMSDQLQPLVFARRSASPIPGQRCDVYQQDVDWVFHQAGVALTPQEVDAKVAALRRGRVRFRDGVS